MEEKIIQIRISTNTSQNDEIQRLLTPPATTFPCRCLTVTCSPHIFDRGGVSERSKKEKTKKNTSFSIAYSKKKKYITVQPILSNTTQTKRPRRRRLLPPPFLTPLTLPRMICGRKKSMQKKCKEQRKKRKINEDVIDGRSSENS